MDSSKYLNLEQFSEATKMDRKTLIEKWIPAHKNVKKIGRRWHIPIEEVEKYLSKPTLKRWAETHGYHPGIVRNWVHQKQIAFWYEDGRIMIAPDTPPVSERGISAMVVAQAMRKKCNKLHYKKLLAIAHSAIEHIGNALVRGEDVTIANFGTFHLHVLPGRQGKRKYIPVKGKPKFKPSPLLQEAVAASPVVPVPTQKRVRKASTGKLRPKLTEVK